MYIAAIGTPTTGDSSSRRCSSPSAIPLPADGCAPATSHPAGQKGANAVGAPFDDARATPILGGHGRPTGRPRTILPIACICTPPPAPPDGPGGVMIVTVRSTPSAAARCRRCRTQFMMPYAAQPPPAMMAVRNAMGSPPIKPAGGALANVSVARYVELLPPTLSPAAAATRKKEATAHARRRRWQRPRRHDCSNMRFEPRARTKQSAAPASVCCESALCTSTHAARASSHSTRKTYIGPFSPTNAQHAAHHSTAASSTRPVANK